MGVSNQTLMRRVRAADGAIVRLGRTRNTRYGLRREIPALGGATWPLYRVDTSGVARPVGTLVSLVADEVAWLPAGEVFVGFPPELDDMKPAGFMGRGFAGQFSELGLPGRLTSWSNDDILKALVRRGEDAPGNLIAGDESFERWSTLEQAALTRADFDDAAARALAGEPVGSSAGGDQPKFAALIDGRQALVKFAPLDTDVGARWCDLLVLEHLALKTLRERNVPAAMTKLDETKAFRFLEVDRFDRVGSRGRIAVLSLAGALQEPSRSWAWCAQTMRDAGVLSEADARLLAFYDAFGALIGNTDRHHYNVLLFPEFDNSTSRILSYRLAPAFDQLPMMFSPRAGGVIGTPSFEPPHRKSEVWDVWDDATGAARAFWTHAAADGRLSPSLREASKGAAKTLR
jgi:hypothetical protein